MGLFWIVFVSFAAESVCEGMEIVSLRSGRSIWEASWVLLGGPQSACDLLSDAHDVISLAESCFWDTYVRLGRARNLLEGKRMSVFRSVCKKLSPHAS